MNCISIFIHLHPSIHPSHPNYTTTKRSKLYHHQKIPINYAKGGNLVQMYLWCQKIWNASRICVSSLRRGHANLLCIVPILVYVMPKQTQTQCGSYLKLCLGLKRKAMHVVPSDRGSFLSCTYLLITLSTTIP